MLIGLHGRKQSGKDTVYARARHLMTHTLTVERVSFADRLYESAAAALGVTVRELQAAKTEPLARVRVTLPPPGGCISEISIREYLQRYGTEAHREVFGDNFWVDAVDLEHAGRLVIVTDVRFENEAQAVIDAGGFVMGVMGPPEVEETDDAHASERPISDWLLAGVIANTVRDDDFQSLDAQISGLIRRRLDQLALEGA